MRLSSRIVSFIVVTSVLPLLLLAFSAVSVVTSWLDTTVSDVQSDAAEIVAGTMGVQLADGTGVLRLQLGNYRVGQLGPEARQTLLLATWRLVPDLAVAALVAPDGSLLGEPVSVRPGQTDAEGHDPVPPERVASLVGRLPPAPPPGEVALGRPYVPDGEAVAVLPVRVSSPWGDGITLGGELSLGRVTARVAMMGTELREVAVVNEEGAVLARGGARGLLDLDAFGALLDNEVATLRYRTAAGEPALGAMARVPGWPLVVLVAQPQRVVGAASRDVTLRTVYIGGLSLVVAVVVGGMLARSITTPVSQLREGAERVSRADFSRPVRVDGVDELAQLATTFNHMTTALYENAREIAAKNEQIEAFNRELQDRVERRTRQLREAQARLVQSGQLAAVAELSAGLAHELNNPLAGILGLLQICSARLGDRPEARLLQDAEAEALRCKDIVANLLRFTRPPGPPTSDEVVDLDAALADVAALVATSMRQKGVNLRQGRSAGPVTVPGDAPSLGRALGQLLTSLRTVAAAGSTLDVGLAEGPPPVLSFCLDRASADEDDWRAAGLAFWVARRVLEEHGATLEEPDPTVRGAGPGPLTWTVRFGGAPSFPGTEPAAEPA